MRRWIGLLGVVVLAIASLVVVWPSEPDKWLPGDIPWPEGRGVKVGGWQRETMRLGLDLQGGTRLLLEANLPADSEGDLDNAIDGAIRVLERRVNASGVSEAEVTRQGMNGISIQIPGLGPSEARNLLGRTALLQFCELNTGLGGPDRTCDADGRWVQAVGDLDGEPAPLTGRFLRPNAFVGSDALGTPAVSFQLDGDGGKLLEQITSRLVRFDIQDPNRRLAIVLDGEVISSPVVQSVLTSRTQITGVSLQEARDLVILLNSGALPVELRVLQEQQVDATLGEDSVERSVLAGQIGLLIVVLFMVLYYRVPGVLAAIALVVYTLVTMAVFKLIPVTLTLSGIAAFVLSVGMAVDANILIFERMKEELRAGRAFHMALDAGFARAWSSIRDSNTTTLITCGILFVLGGGLDLPGLGTFDAPLVQGFAVTLAIGVLISMFSAITVTRWLLKALVGTWIARQPDLLGAGIKVDSSSLSDGSSAGGDA